MSKARQGPGRPKKARKAVALVTRRVRGLIDLAHDGNIRQASEETGIAYATLRDLYSGRRANPGLKTVKALAAHYQVHMQWFTDERQAEPVPISGYIGYLDPPPGMRGRRPHLREVVIPFAAWEFLRVVQALDRYVESLPSSPKRLIVGETTGREGLKLLTTFLLQPLLAAEAMGEPGAIVPDDDVVTRQQEENWVRKLRVLGRMWEVAIPGLLAKARQAVR